MDKPTGKKRNDAGPENNASPKKSKLDTAIVKAQLLEKLYQTTLKGFSTISTLAKGDSEEWKAEHLGDKNIKSMQAAHEALNKVMTPFDNRFLLNDIKTLRSEIGPDTLLVNFEAFNTLDKAVNKLGHQCATVIRVHKAAFPS